MTEITVNKHKRHVWMAIMLSMIVPGLGQVYCGKLFRGLLLSLLNTLPISLFVMVLLFKNTLTLILAAAGMIIFGGIIELIAVIDSIYLAKHTSPNYQIKEYNKWYVYLLLIFMSGWSGSVGIAYYVKTNICEAFRVPASSMYPTILNGDRVLANKTVYNKLEPRKGDVVIFLNPENRLQHYIKRVVAMAGDRVEMKNNRLYVNGQMLEWQPLSKTELDALNINGNDPNFQGDMFYEINGSARYKIFLKKSADEKKYDFAEITVPKYNCFVLGDNRNNSYDSRNYGTIPIATIKGKANWLYWPLSRFNKVE
ncbi:MAG: signal peptidase I [Planctomycetaceae bacterium]|nr:signal peptidase I [Planctomycetaceae bacterium]